MQGIGLPRVPLRSTTDVVEPLLKPPEVFWVAAIFAVLISARFIVVLLVRHRVARTQSAIVDERHVCLGWRRIDRRRGASLRG